MFAVFHHARGVALVRQRRKEAREHERARKRGRERGGKEGREEGVRKGGWEGGREEQGEREKREGLGWAGSPPKQGHRERKGRVGQAEIEMPLKGALQRLLALCLEKGWAGERERDATRERERDATALCRTHVARPLESRLVRDELFRMNCLQRRKRVSGFLRTSHSRRTPVGITSPKERAGHVRDTDPTN